MKQVVEQCRKADLDEAVGTRDDNEPLADLGREGGQGVFYFRQVALQFVVKFAGNELRLIFEQLLVCLSDFVQLAVVLFQPRLKVFLECDL